MSIVYFDCFSGVSGDMFLGALIDLGLNVEVLAKTLKNLGLENFELNVEKTRRNDISATNLHVITEPENRRRNLQDIVDIVYSSALSDSVKQRVERVFTTIAEAESTVHNIPMSKVHFHEVGALDSIIDIVGSIWGLEQLGIETCYSSAITLGSGSIECAHGIIPVPAPATLEIVKNFPVVKKEIGTEVCTPTGAALVTELSEYRDQLPQMKISKIGYGCGDRIIKQIPNMFRIFIGEAVKFYEEDRLLVVETNIDDMNTELFPYVMNRLFESGAVDVFLTPVIMKKGRPGNVLSFLTDEKSLDGCLDIIFSETTSIGIRMYETSRRKLPRSREKLKTPWGTIQVKSIDRFGKKVILPEYEECKKIAIRENIPIEQVYSTVKRLGNPDD